MDTSPAPGQRSDPPAGTLVGPATCLGCGCTCDDIAVRVAAGQIVETRNACDLGAAWFGTGATPSRTLVAGRDASSDAALDAAAALLAGASRPLVYLAPDVSTETQREAIAIADLLRARIDSLTSTTVMPSIVAAQERGRAGATLGEIRNRADVLVFWGVDPAVRYPRFWTRYAPEPAGLQIAGGRQGRTIVAVDIDGAKGPADADLRVAIPGGLEVATLIATTAAAQEPAPPTQPTGNAAAQESGDPTSQLVAAVRAGRYVAIVVDSEPPSEAPGNAGDSALSRASALIGLAQALNGVTRCALVTLRGGGNRNGADAALTAQTGYPAGVDFSRGYPRYRPWDGAAAGLDGQARPGAGTEADAVLVIGALDRAPDGIRALAARAGAAVIGPRASTVAAPAAAAAIDTGTAGIHCGGTALRMDDVPLPLRPALSGPPDPALLIRGLRERLFLLPLAGARP